jgi:predicted  nucleic acid-binding Zn-ribbon protein
MEIPKYITSAGVRVPANWTVEDLGKALAKRKITFSNEREIMDVFGDALRVKEQLEKAIEQLTRETTRLSSDVRHLESEWNTLQKEIKRLENQLLCPHCKQSLNNEKNEGGLNQQ